MNAHFGRSALSILALGVVLTLCGCPFPPGSTGTNQQALTGTLTIIVAGSGTGGVGPALPPGIFNVAGPACDSIKRLCNASVSGDPVTLRAKAGTSDDSVFVGWAGACSGTGDCTVTVVGTPVVALFRKTSVTLGGWFTCGLKTTGVVKCWGENDHGELGDGTRNTPLTGAAHTVMLPGSRTAVDISANGFHACALLDNASVFCWGSTAHSETGPSPGSVVPLPTLAMGVAAGSWHSCAVLVNGLVRCWGSDSDGQIEGTNHGGDMPLPTPVPSIAGAIAVTAGAYHSCALRGSTQDILCWGHNRDGELGSPAPANGIAGTAFRPFGGAPIARIAGGVGAGVIGLTATGGYNTCVQTSDGRIDCVGNNDRFQVTPTVVGTRINGDTIFFANNLPQQFSSIAVGGYFMCAVGHDDQRVYCWGDDSAAQFGNGSAIGYGVNSATLAAALPDSAWSVAAGAYHTCAVVSHDTIRCWGSNNWGQTGAIANGGDSDTPVTPAW